MFPKVVNFDYKKHLPQSSSDKTNDLFFILAALYIANEEEKDLTKLTLEKVLFQASKTLAETKKYKFFNTFFYINKYGPHNNMFYKYLHELQDGGLVITTGNNIYLTLKGSDTLSKIIETLSKESDLSAIFISLKDFVDRYSGNNSTRAVNETHIIKVQDTTDKNIIKTIQQIIDEIKPEQQFKSASDFKYIEPFEVNKVKNVKIPPKIINNLEEIIANVKEEDFQTEAEINQFFMRPH